MGKHKILGLVLPTVHPERVFNRIFSNESLEQLKIICNVGTILINFQPPYNESIIKSVIDKLKSYNIPVKYTYNTYEILEKGHVPFNKIRSDASELLDCKFYALVDDDFLFQGSVNNTLPSSHQYLEAVHYMLIHDNCGLVQLRPRKKRIDEYVPNGWIYPTPIISKWQTDSGMILKSMKSVTDEGNLFPKDSLALVGVGEERILAGYRLSKGLYPARLNHCNVNNNPPENLYGWWSVDLENKNVTKFIKDHYNKDHENKLGNPCSYESYYSNGGVEYNEQTVNNLKYDYNGISTENLISSIIKLEEEK